MVEDHDLDAGGDDALKLAVDSSPRLVVAELGRNVLEAVDVNGVHVGVGGHELRERPRLTGAKREGQRPRPDGQAKLERVSVGFGERASRSSGNLPRAVAGEIKAPAPAHPNRQPQEVVVADADAAQAMAEGEGRLANPRRGNEHQRLTLRVGDYISPAPNGLDLGGAVENELGSVEAAGVDAGEPTEVGALIVGPVPRCLD
jgi:hypothetical protein